MKLGPAWVTFTAPLIGETTLLAFPAFRVEAQGSETVLTGVLPDQSALYGVLAQMEALGLQLIEVRRQRPDHA